tara:strand:- start:1446 stop:2159 length:714 start_codon:yes stop_codon:yes gene_type:complete
MKRGSFIFKIAVSILGFSMIGISLYCVQNKYDVNNDIIVWFVNKPEYIPLSEDDIVKICSNYLNQKDSLSDMNIHLLEDLISNNEYVQEAELYLDVNGKLNALIYCREALVRIINDKIISYADYNGFLSELKDVNKKLLVLTGFVDLNSDLMTLIKYINNNKKLKSLVGGIHVDKDRGYILSIKNCEISVYLGTNPLLNENKASMLSGVYDFFLKELGCDYCNAINLEYKNQIICIK